MTIMMEYAGLLAGIINSRSPAKPKLDVTKVPGAALDVAEAFIRPHVMKQLIASANSFLQSLG
jgi:hypothetical protein